MVKLGSLQSKGDLCLSSNDLCLTTNIFTGFRSRNVWMWLYLEAIDALSEV